MKQMKVENDFEFYDLLQHVTPRSQRPIWPENIRNQSSKVDAQGHPYAATYFVHGIGSKNVRTL